MKQVRADWVIGTMSGTSLDGVDAAFLRTDGETIFEFGPLRYRAYTPEQRQLLSRALGLWQDGPEGVLSAAETVIEDVHLDVLRPMLGLKDTYMIGFHGHTLAHDPAGRGTYQIGNGAHLADQLGVNVAWDMRSEDVRQGGQGAPLAAFYHFACAKYIKAAQPLAFLNLGGVGNVTYVDPSYERPDMDGAVTAFDTGPANAPINDLMLARRGESYDALGALAASGTPSAGVVEAFLSHPYFAQRPPKSLDRNGFGDVVGLVAGLCDADAAATLTEISVGAVARGLQELPQKPESVLVCGGGRLNTYFLTRLSEILDMPVRPVDAVGLDGDMLEAQAFAYLAKRVEYGLPLSGPASTGVPRAMAGGVFTPPAEPGRRRDQLPDVRADRAR